MNFDYPALTAIDGGVPVVLATLNEPAAGVIATIFVVELYDAFTIGLTSISLAKPKPIASNVELAAVVVNV